LDDLIDVSKEIERLEKEKKTLEKELAQFCGVKHAVSCASGTRLDLAEKNCFARHLSTAKVLAPKFVLGESLACSTLQQVISGVLALDELRGGNALVTTTGYSRQLAGLVLTRD
jgi:hypothetical protein